VTTGRLPKVDAVAGGLVARTLATPPTLAGTRLVCVDGPAGSGKTTLAAALDRGFRDALRSPGAPAGRGHVQVLHMDNLFEGWSGLSAGMATLTSSVLAPLAAGAPGRYRRYDWHGMALAEERVVAPCDVLVVEGVGSGGSAHEDAITLLVWVDTPPDVRLQRGLARDGEHMRWHWVAWAAQEQEMFARERTRERADVVVDGATGAPVWQAGRHGGPER
jgi:uridine kinase